MSKSTKAKPFAQLLYETLAEATPEERKSLFEEGQFDSFVKSCEKMYNKKNPKAKVKVEI